MLKLGRRSQRVSFRVTSSWQNLKQPANGREQTQMVFRANGQKTQRLATGRENPQTDEKRACRIPASQPCQFANTVQHVADLLSTVIAVGARDDARSCLSGHCHGFNGNAGRAEDPKACRASTTHRRIGMAGAGCRAQWRVHSGTARWPHSP